MGDCGKEMSQTEFLQMLIESWAAGTISDEEFDSGIADLNKYKD